MLIYKITNLVTGKIYVGQTTMTLLRRWRVHKSAKRQTPLCNSLKKHGHNNFTIEPICSVLALEHLDALEIDMIAYYDCMTPNGYNVLSGGNASQSRGQPAWNKGKKATAQAIANQSVSHLGQPAWNKGLTTSDAVKAKQSTAKVGKHMNPATEFKTGAESAFKGRKHSPEALAKISANGNRRAVICNETGETYASIADASIKLSIAKSYLRRIIISGQKHKKTGFTFKFVHNKD
jgi:group I intron endonuclease